MKTEILKMNFMGPEAASASMVVGGVSSIFSFFQSYLISTTLRWDSQQASPWNKEHKQCSI